MKNHDNLLYNDNGSFVELIKSTNNDDDNNKIK